MRCNERGLVTVFPTVTRPTPLRDAAARSAGEATEAPDLPHRRFAFTGLFAGLVGGSLLASLIGAIGQFASLVVAMNRLLRMLDIRAGFVRWRLAHGGAP